MGKRLGATGVVRKQIYFFMAVGQFYTVAEIAREMLMTYNGVLVHLRKLQKQGKIELVVKGDGPRPRVLWRRL